MLDFASGQTLLFNKPLGWTSFDVVNKVRRTIRIKKVGHAGTLDPLATGLLILCTGKHTKTIEGIQGQEKVYEALIQLGATTASYDAEQPEENIQDATHVTEEQIRAEIASHFLGKIQQVPPAFSAIKVKGKRAYKAARAGKPLELKKREVEIYEFDLLGPGEFPASWKARIRCSKGTYIRSLAHDLGQNLGVGGYLKGLIRTQIGGFKLEDAWEVQDFVEKVKEAFKEQEGAKEESA